MFVFVFTYVSNESSKCSNVRFDRHKLNNNPFITLQKRNHAESNSCRLSSNVKPCYYESSDSNKSDNENINSSDEEFDIEEHELNHDDEYYSKKKSSSNINQKGHHNISSDINSKPNLNSFCFDNNYLTSTETKESNETMFPWVYHLKEMDLEVGKMVSESC